MNLCLSKVNRHNKNGTVFSWLLFAQQSVKVVFGIGSARILELMSLGNGHLAWENLAIGVKVETVKWGKVVCCWPQKARRVIITYTLVRRDRSRQDIAFNHNWVSLHSPFSTTQGSRSDFSYPGFS